MTELLNAYSRIRTSDVEKFRETVSEVLRPCRLEPYLYRDTQTMVFNAVELEAITLCYKTYGAPMRVRHEPLDSFVLVHFSLVGSLATRVGRAETHYDKRVAAIIDPDADYDTSIEAGAEGLMLRVERSALQAELQRILGAPPPRPLRVATTLDMAAPRARSFYSMLRALCADLDGPQGVRHPALKKPLQRLVIAQLLTTLHHSASDALAGMASAASEDVGPRAIRRAEEIIREHCREHLTVSDIAEAAGVSVRGLQNGFRRYLDTTPTERLRRARLAGAHAELLAADATRVTVSRVASEWGFRHLGRFSRSYQEAFSETPSETLRR